MNYGEGAEVGYRWTQARGLAPLFPFGFGLSYTEFRFSGLKATGGRRLTASFLVTNAGTRPGLETAQVYASPPGGTRRLIGWRKLALKPGETRRVSVTADPRLLSRFDAALGAWRWAGGSYGVAVGGSSADLPLTGSVSLAPLQTKP